MHTYIKQKFLKCNGLFRNKGKQKINNDTA